MKPIVSIGFLETLRVRKTALVSLGTAIIENRNISKTNSSVQMIGDSLVNGPIDQVDRNDADSLDNISL